jgi:hypothetical protein
MKHTSVNSTYCKVSSKNAAKSHKNYETHSYPIVDTTKNMKVYFLGNYISWCTVASGGGKQQCRTLKSGLGQTVMAL